MDSSWMDFKPFRNGRSDYNAREVIVIDAPEKGVGVEHSCRHNMIHRTAT